MKVPEVPRRFRRRLLITFLVLGLGPLVVVLALGGALARRALSLSPPLDPLLGQVEAALGPHDGNLAAAVAEARLHLGLAELARRKLVERVPLGLAAAVLVSAALVAAGAWVVGRRVVRPLDKLSAGMAALGRGETPAALAPTNARRDELDDALSRFDAMATELHRYRERLAATLRLAAWHEVARTMAHELRNPLTAMKMSVARVARPGRTEEAIGEAAQLLTEQLDVLIRMTDSFAAFARLPEPSPRVIALRPVLVEIAALYGEGTGMTVAVRGDLDAHVNADTDHMRRLFGNLTKNAIEAGGPVVIDIAASAADVRVTIADEGPGIGAALEGAALVRGIGSTKANGSGLGLAVAYKIAHEHGGSIRLEPRAPRGTAATVELPRVQT